MSRHRAIQWMIDPPHDGGLGLDIHSTAHIAGHRDGGYLVCSTYSKLAERRALAARGAPWTPTNNAHKTAKTSSQNLRSRRSRSAKDHAAAAIELQYAATTQ
jgi:hypothetical protein